MSDDPTASPPSILIDGQPQPRRARRVSAIVLALVSLVLTAWGSGLSLAIGNIFVLVTFAFIALPLSFLAFLCWTGSALFYGSGLHVDEIGARRRSRFGFLWPVRWAHPERPAVRYDEAARTSDGFLWIDSRTWPVQLRRSSRVRRLPYGLTHRLVQLVRDLVPEARHPANFTDIDRPTHCPTCGYRLATPDGREVRLCPECGWRCEADDLVLFGRPGSRFTGTLLSKPAGLFGEVRVVRETRRAIQLSSVIFLAMLAVAFIVWSTTNVGNFCVYFIGVWVVWLLISWVLRQEDDAAKRGRLADADLFAAGAEVVLVGRRGIAQWTLGDGWVEPEPWDAFERITCHPWPGGARIRAIRRGKLPLWWRKRHRAVDFVCDLAEPRAEARRLRERVYALSHAAVGDQ